MNKKEGWGILGIALLGLAAAAPAAAQEGGVYLGASLGTGTPRNVCSGITGTCDDSDTAYKLFGGYQMNRSLGWELGYGYLGKATASGTDALGTPVNFELSSKALDFSGIAALPVNDRFALFGRLGIYRSQVERRGTPSGSAHNTSFTWGAGLRFDFGRAFALRAEWQHYPELGNDSTGKNDIDLLTAGLVMRF